MPGRQVGMPVCMRDNGHELGLDSCPTDRPIARLHRRNAEDSQRDCMAVPSGAAPGRDGHHQPDGRFSGERPPAQIRESRGIVSGLFLIPTVLRRDSVAKSGLISDRLCRGWEPPHPAKT